MLLAGCATHKPAKAQPNYLLFDADPQQSGLWRPRYDDLIETAKAYIKKSKVRFDFENTVVCLRVFQKDGGLVARVEFGRKSGYPWLAVDLDTSGKPTGYQLGFEDLGDFR
jgi:hypothetical protein